MANGKVLGYRILGERQASKTKACPRCGYLRNTDGGGKGRTGLCKDCSSGMSPEEREQWK